MYAGVTEVGARLEPVVLSRGAEGATTMSAGPELKIDALRSTPVATVLNADAYSLQLVEAPNVPPEEIREAVRWRIQHLIEFPVEEAVIETFEMPAPANPGAKSMIYAVVARRSEISALVERIRASNLDIRTIEIPELCMRNIAVTLPQDAQGVALLHFVDGCGYLTITRGGVLYMLRRIETQSEDHSESLQEIALEVQRSLDYYESQYDCRPISEIVLGPGDDIEVLAASLTENLGISVSQLKLDELFTMDSELPVKTQGECLLAVGAALRSVNRIEGRAA